MKNPRNYLFLCVMLVLAFGSGSVYGWQAGSGLLVNETYLEMESVGNPNISPDGNFILFTRTGVDKMKDRSKSNLLMYNMESGRISELTTGSFRVSSPVWSPDGGKIVFLSDRSGTNQIHMMWLDTREVIQLTNLDQSPGGLRWSPDGGKIAFTMFTVDDSPILPVKIPKFPKGADMAKPAIVIDRLSWRRDGSGPTQKGNTHIYTVEIPLGGTPVQITSGDYSHRGPRWSPDGKYIYFSGILKPDVEYQRGDSEIYSIDLSTHDITPLTDRKGPDRSPVISPDGQSIAYLGYDENDNYSNLSNLYLMNSTGENKRLLAGNLPNSPSGVTWAADGSGLYYTMGEKGSSNVYFVSTGGSIRKITDGVHYISGISVSKSGRVAATNSTYYKPNFLVTFDLDNPDYIKTLVDVNEDVLGNAKLGEVEEMWFKSPDGLDLQGWLMKPAEYEPGTKYPMLLWIHGGPVSMYTVRFNWAWQNFAAEGYAVLWMNPRGSTGYGQEFVNGINYFYPGNDFDDLMASVDAAIERGFIDEDNLFVTGGSGGGVLTAWIVGHTNRFRAAVSMRPVINWHSFVGTTDGASWYRRFRSYPWEDPMEYAERSPLHYVANVTTPTMILTGESDLRTPISQSEEYYRALKTLRKDTLLVRIPDEYHGFRRTSHRLMQQQYLKAWFDKYRVKPKPGTEK